MNTVFLDTVGLLAIWDQSDQWHLAATAAFAKVAAGRCRIITTNFVLFECGNAAARTPYRVAVYRLRLELQRKGQIYEPTVDELESAWTAFRDGHTGTAGIVDRISFEVLLRLGITDVLTNDQHFKNAGFHTLF